MMIAEAIVNDSTVDAVEAAISGLANLATVEVHDHPGEIPRLYDAAAQGLVRYQREEPEAQTWITPLAVLERGWGDCKHFSAWRVAELRAQGKKAMVCVIDRRTRDRPGRFHAVVEHEDGTLEDPSKIVIALSQQGRNTCTTEGTMNTECKIKPHGRGYVAGLSAPVFRGHRLAFASLGDSRADALAKASGVFLSLLNDPIMQALVPPQVGETMAAYHEISQAAKAGTLDQWIDKIAKPSEKKVAQALSAEMKDLNARASAAQSAARTRVGRRSPLDDMGAPSHPAGYHGSCIRQRNSATNQCDFVETVYDANGNAVPVPGGGATSSGPCPANWATLKCYASNTAAVDRFGNPISSSVPMPPPAPLRGAPINAANPRDHRAPGSVTPAAPMPPGYDPSNPYGAPPPMPPGYDPSNPYANAYGVPGYAPMPYGVAPWGAPPFYDPSNPYAFDPEQASGEYWDATFAEGGISDVSGVSDVADVGHVEVGSLDDMIGGRGRRRRPRGMLGVTAAQAQAAGYVWNGDHWERAPAYNATPYGAPYPGAYPSSPYGQWSYGMDPYVYPGQVPFGYGWNPAAPGSNTGLYAPVFGGGPGGIPFPDPSSSSWYSDAAAEAMFAGAARMPPPGNWADEFAYGQNGQGFMSDVGNVDGPAAVNALAAVNPFYAELLGCARENGWFDGNGNAADGPTAMYEPSSDAPNQQSLADID